MTARVFVDTNVLVYVYDGRDSRKQALARAALEELATDSFSPIVSTQVLQEAWVALTRKLRIDPAAATASLQQLEPAGFRVQPVVAATVWKAAERTETDRLSFWDALIVESSLAADCTLLYSEDLQEGRTFGGLRVVNPFAAGGPARVVNDRRR